jgi:soluble lytic murein transglycosylase-like protein
VLAAAVCAALAWPAEAARPQAEALGISYYHSGQFREAAVAFRRALAIRPGDAGLWLWLGASELRAGNPAAAVRALERARTRWPRHPDVLLWLGRAYEAAGKSTPASATFARVVAVAPHSPAAEWVRQKQRARAPVLARGVVLRATDPRTFAELARRHNRRLTASEAERIGWSVVFFSRRFNVDPRLVAAVITIESGFNPRAVSRAGALGLGQLMPATARAVGVRDPFSIEENVYGTVRVLRGHLDRYGFDNVALALAAYNAGSGAVRAHGGIPPYAETTWYVYNVLSLYLRLLRAG